MRIFNNNWGYTTPVQKRFKIGYKSTISKNKDIETPFAIGEKVVIIETGRHDYLVENNSGIKAVVYQFELD